MTDAVADAAVEATRRVLLLSVAVSILASATIAALVVSTVNAAAAPAWWSIWTIAAFGALAFGGAVGQILGSAVGRRVVRVAAVAFVAAVVVYPLAGLAAVAAGQDGTIPWLLTAVSAPSLAILVVGGWRWTAGFFVVWIAVVVLSRTMLDGYTLTGLANDTQALLSAVTTCVVAEVALRTAVHVDRAAVLAAAAAVGEAEERARLSARSRAAAFVHDEVLAALRGVADGTPGTEDAVRRQAARATATVRAHPPTADLVDRIAALAAEAGAVFDTERRPTKARCSPEVADALVAATAQALQNARRHAPGAACRIRVEVQTTGGRIEIADDGPGFCPDRVATDRLGLETTVLGVPRAIPGVRAEVDSAPGAGTRVLLEWNTAEPIPPTSVDGWTLVTRERIVAAIFVVTQTAVAAVAAVQAGLAGPGAVSVVMLAVLFLLTGVVGSAQRGITRVSALAIVGLLIGSVALGLSSLPAPVSYGSAWFVTAASFVLVALALRDRGGIALVGGGILLGVLSLDALGRPADLPQILGMGTRIATIVGLSVVFVAMLRRLRRSAEVQAERRVASARRTAWDAAAHAELVAYLTEVDKYARPLLERVVCDGVTAANRAEAGAVEGRLRDGYRAGRLHGHGIADAAMQARLRGVDVVLLDDGGEPGPAEAWVPEFAALVRERLGAAERRVVVRVLPPGRPALGHVVADGRLTTYPPVDVSAVSAGSTSIGVHGE